jgi:hypothetical protein
MECDVPNGPPIPSHPGHSAAQAGNRGMAGSPGRRRIIDPEGPPSIPGRADRHTARGGFIGVVIWSDSPAKVRASESCAM